MSNSQIEGEFCERLQMFINAYERSDMFRDLEP